MVRTNAMDFIVNLLINNWNSDNTDSLTPHIAKITSVKRHSYDALKDAIFVHRSQHKASPAGHGTISKDVYEYLKIDVRTLGEGLENHWYKVLTEVERILDSNMILPTVGSSSYCELRPDSQHEDVSDKTYYLWRELIPITLVKFNVTRNVGD